MSKAGFKVYLLATGEQSFEVRFSLEPQFELDYLNQLEGPEFEAYCLTEPLPIALASYLQQLLAEQIKKEQTQVREGTWLQKLGEKLGTSTKKQNQILELCLTQLQDILGYYSLQERIVGRKINLEPGQHFKLPSSEEKEGVYQILKGRLLYYQELEQALEENQIKLSTSLLKLLKVLKLEGKVEFRPSIAYLDRNYLLCQRCGQNQDLVKVECELCALEDYYCNNCLYMGKSRLCRPLFAFSGAEERALFSTPLQVVEPKLEFELTAAQADASRALVRFVEGAKKEALLWAVCGAGKTEVSFGAIARALSRGAKVLFAIPRKDPVIELAPRLEQSFVDFEVTTLHGSATEKYQATPLTIATTHQVLRFIDHFELVLLDEMDAFPYQGSKMLKMAVERAAHPEGKIIYMTATPGNNLLDFEYQLKKELIKIPARYHGHPVPVPKLLALGLEYDKQQGQVQLPAQVWDFIESSIQQELAQLFIFVPTKKLAKIVGQRLQEELPEVNGLSWVQYSHSESPDREQKRDAFSQGEYPILVSTTIMERGITVDRAHVLVLFADWSFIFDPATLIQMAGRAGRSLEYPTGEVLFVANKISREMKEAQERIESLNREARKKGYLKE